MEISENDFFFFAILTIHTDITSYVKHVLDPLYVFFTLLGCWRGGEVSPKGLKHNLLTQHSTHSNSKMEIPQTDFFVILTIKSCFRPSVCVFQFCQSLIPRPQQYLSRFANHKIQVWGT